MFQNTFLIVFSLFLYTQTVFSQWEFAGTTKGKIKFFDSNWTEVSSSAHDFDELTAITFDEIEEKIYFNDHMHNNGSIFSLKIPLAKGDGHIIERVVARTRDEMIGGIAYDPLNRNIYWTDVKNKKIYFAPIDHRENSEPKILFDFENDDTKPDGIAIDICRRKIYWTSSNKQNPNIQVASLSGENRTTIVNTDLYFPHAIFVDQLSDRIFYVVQQMGVHFTVESTNLDGTDRQIVVESKYNLPFSLTVTGDSVYWTDLQNKAVWMAPKFNPQKVAPKIVENLNNLRGIVSRMKMLSKLKNDSNCKGLIRKIESTLYPQKDEDNRKMKKAIEENNNVFCLSNGRYSNVSKTCNCKAGFSGARCEIYDCHNFCVHGTCNIVDGFPKCTCQIGFSGDRCQTSECNSFCMNKGECSISYDEPYCDCREDFFGSRCEHNANETCAPFCLLLRNDVEVDLPHQCYRVCKNLHPEDKIIQNLQRPEESCRSIWNWSLLAGVLGLFGCLAFVWLIIKAIQRLYKPARPRIRKTFVVQKKVSQTPLTCRPIATEQCEITIENCCNMNICDTPCFDPKLLKKNMDKESTKEDKDVLIDNMEHEIY